MLNLLLVWLLTGLWHGANWTFIVWGLYYFCFLTLEKLTGLNKLLAKIPLVGNVFTLFVVIIGWVIFRSSDLPSALQHIGLMFGLYNNPLTDEIFIYQLLENRVHLAVALLACLPLVPAIKSLCQRFKVQVGRGWLGAPLGIVRDGVLLVVLVLVLAALAKGSYNPFIYFNF